MSKLTVNTEELRRAMAEDEGPHHNSYQRSEARLALHTVLRASIGPLLDELERLRAVYEAAVTYCDVYYKGIPHPRYPAYPCVELLLKVNAIRLGPTFTAIDAARGKEEA